MSGPAWMPLQLGSVSVFLVPLECIARSTTVAANESDEGVHAYSVTMAKARLEMLDVVIWNLRVTAMNHLGWSLDSTAGKETEDRRHTNYNLHVWIQTLSCDSAAARHQPDLKNLV